MRIAISNSLGSSRNITPRSFAGLALWLDAAKGITLGGTLLAAGTTPPAVTITGTTSQAVGLRVEITTGGARGTAVFRWSLDNGATWAESGVLTAATYALPGVGITLNFATGTYSTDNVYQGVVTEWRDQSNNGRHFAQSTPANQPRYLVATLGGRPSLRFDGSNDHLERAYDADLNAAASTLYVVAVKRGGTGFRAIYACRTITDSSFRGFTVYNNGETQWRLQAGKGATSVWGVDVDVAPAASTDVPVIAEAVLSAGSRILRINALESSTSADVYVPNGDRPQRIGAGATEGAANFFHNGDICEVVQFSRALSTDERSAMRKYLGAKWGIAA